MYGGVTLTIKNGTLAGRTWEFDASQDWVLGRADDCDVRLAGSPEFAPVSRRHCLLRVDPPGAWVRDLGSFNGTHLNGMQIGRPAGWDLPPEVRAAPFREYALHDGDELQIGHTVIVVSLPPGEEDGPSWVMQVGEGEAVCAGR